MVSAPNTITKIMSATDEEFAQSLRVLIGRDVAAHELPLALALGPGRVEIAREPLVGVRLGGLLDLPRAAVTLVFHDVSEAERAAFLRRFDFAFQRGGG